ncbi:MAG: hypothetical protein IPM82_05850 [Saprospiraceae bacterium]|nr:hypothetical protein [Saprospiraceae bacterium]
MRRLSSLLLLCIPLIAAAQGRKGDWLLRGNIWVNHYENENEKSYRVNYQYAQIGYYVRDGLSIGIIEELSLNRDYWSVAGFQPFLRGTLFLKRFSPFLQISGGGKWFKDRFPRYYDYQLFYLNLRAGAGVRIGSFATIDMSLNLRVLQHIDPSNADDKISPILVSGFHLTYHFPNEKTPFDSISLSGVYLNKRVKTIGLEISSLPTGTASIMLKNHVQLGIIWSSFLGNDGRINYAWNRIVAEVRPFFEMKENTFFVPTTGVSLSSVTIAKPFNFDGLAQVHVHPNIVHFFKRYILEIGVEARYLLGDSSGNPSRFSATSILGAQYFFSQKLSLNTEFRGSLSGNDWPVKSDNYWRTNGDTQFRLGFRYFY